VAEASARRPDVLRVVSYNVRDLLDDRDAVAHVVRSCRPDVLCLQEAPRRPLTLHRLRRLARETGLRWVTGGRASGGTAVLAHPRLDVVEARASRLAVTGWFTRRRGYALATVVAPGSVPVTVVSVHLPLRADERAAHTRAVLARLEGLAPPHVVAGDLNEPPEGPSWTALVAALRDVATTPGSPDPAATYPARAPRVRIDAVLVSADLQVLDAHVAGPAERLDAALLARASDHVPLVADLRPTPTPS
jgi:endonuclease/exonuclease/phosphatase family metal-dependent hydrolase